MVERAATLPFALVLLLLPGVAFAQERAAAAAPASRRAAPNLAGRWELNARESELPTGDVPLPTGGRTVATGPFGGYGGGGSTGATGGGLRGGSSGSARGVGSTLTAANRDELQRALRASRFLLIVQGESQLTLTDDEGRVVVLKPDGSKIKEERLGVSIERTTRWDDRSLVTVVKLHGGAKLTQTFTKASEGLQLIVFTKAEGGGLPRAVEARRVYDQALQ